MAKEVVVCLVLGFLSLYQPITQGIWSVITYLPYLLYCQSLVDKFAVW